MVVAEAQEKIVMASIGSDGLTLVTGANGQIGREVCRQLRAAHAKFLATDVDQGPIEGFQTIDLRCKADVSRLFESQPVRTVIHLAAILPTAFRADPLLGADVNLTACFELMRQAMSVHVKRFVFASSRSVYGLTCCDARPLTETDPVMPDEPYGAAKCVVESVGTILAAAHSIEFVALRIAVVLGLGVRETSSSAWRSQIFESPSGSDPIKIPFAPRALLPLVHVEDVARALIVLAGAPKLEHAIYNLPAETWEARLLKEMVEKVRGVRVELHQEGPHGGPLCDSSRFVREFGFPLRGLRERLSCRPGPS